MSSEEIKYKKYTDYFNQKEIGFFLDTFLSKQVDIILDDLNKSYENGDLKKCNEIIQKIDENRMFKIFSAEKKVILLDLIIKKILPYLICNSSNILNFLTKIRFLIPKNYVIDFKFFYSLYYILYKKYKHEINNYIPLFKSLYKYIPLNSISKDDYNLIKKNFMEELNNQNKSYAISIFMYFLPKKYVEEDYEIQYKLFLLLKNCKNYFVGCCCMFSKILKKDGKIFFSQDEQKNKEFIEIFIKYFFTNLNLYIIDDPSIKNSNYSSPVFHSNDKNKRKNKFDHCVIDTLLYLIFNTNLEKDLYNNILSHLKLILNNKHLYIKEKSSSTLAKNFIKFISDFFHRLLSSIFSKKNYEEKINKKIKSLIDFNKTNESLFNKLLDLIQIFSTCLKKFFLYENDNTFPCLQKVFNFLGNINSDTFMEKLVQKLDFNEYMKMLKFFEENIETKSLKFINKLQTILPLLLSEYIYSHFNSVQIFIKNIIVLISDSISSANIQFDVNVLIIFATNFFDVKNKIKKNKIYESLIPLIDEASIKIMNNIIGFLDLICIKNNSEFCFFIHAMEIYLDENRFKNISKKYAEYIQNYEIESKYLKYYFNVINKNEHEYIFNYIYNNMIYVDKSNDIKINEYFLYPEKDDDLKINVKYCSLEIFEKQIDKYQNIISLLDFSKILTLEKNIKHFYQIYFTLINNPESNFKRLAIILFKTVLNSFINSKIKQQNNELIIEYPSKENIILINTFYKKLILPYENYIKENIDKIETINKKFEQIIYIYTMLINIVSITKLNIIILTLEQDGINKINTELIEAYKEYKKLISNSENVIKQIYEYKNGVILNNNININSCVEKIINNKLMMNSGEMTEKRNLLKGKKTFLYKYFHLNHLKNYWLKKKLKVMNYNYFSLIKNFIQKNNSYYDYLYIFAKNINEVNHNSNTVSYSNKFLYSLNKEKIKEIYEKIFTVYKNELNNNIKEESETEKNKMKNISDTFTELSLVYLNLFPKDIINVLIKLGNIFISLKIKKFNVIEKLMRNILTKIKSFIYLPISSQKAFSKIKNKFSGKNDIILNVLNNIKINEKILEENKAYYDIIKQILNFIVEIFNDENTIINNIIIIKEKENNINLINEREKMFILFRLKEFIIDTVDKNDTLYKKIIKLIFDNILSKFVPVSSKYMWMKLLYYFIKEEYQTYKKYKYIKFKNEEEYNKTWKELKYKIKGKKKNEILPLYNENIRTVEFNYNDEIKNNLNFYKINAKELIEILKQVDEWLEEKNLINNNDITKHRFYEMLKKFIDFSQDNKGIDIKIIKTFYYMLELNYIDYNNDFVKNFKLQKNNNKILPIIYEFSLAKYNYMFNHNFFSNVTKKEFWEILNYYTNGSNKNEDEKIIIYFKYLFNISSLENILFIFNNDDIKVNYPDDFMIKLFNIYYSSFINLLPEKNIFKNNYMLNIINTIITNDENLILYTSDLKHIINVYFHLNNLIKYSYDSFEEKYDKKEIIKFIMNNFISKDFSKRSRYALYEIYISFFNSLNDIILKEDDFSLFNLIIPKIALCANELKDDSRNKIIQSIEEKYRCFNRTINFEILCEKICSFLKKEENSNDANKILYLQIVNIVYNSQKFFNLDFNKNENFTLKDNYFFKNLYKVFEAIKNENLKIKFASVFVSFFNDLPENENEIFIKNYDELIKNENYIYILMSQLLRFRMNLPLYIQNFIEKIKNIINDDNKNIIKAFLKMAMDNYHGSFIYMKKNISSKSKDILEELTIEKSYFV